LSFRLVVCDILGKLFNRLPCHQHAPANPPHTEFPDFDQPIYSPHTDSQKLCGFSFAMEYSRLHTRMIAQEAALSSDKKKNKVSGKLSKAALKGRGPVGIVPSNLKRMTL
jgi:hypothetical protein